MTNIGFLFTILLTGVGTAFADITDSGSLTISGQGVIGGTMTVSGNAFSVGGSTLAVNGGKVGIGTTSPAQPLSVVGTVESTSGGFKFPDGTTQASAASAASIGYSSSTHLVMVSSGDFTAAKASTMTIPTSSSTTYTVRYYVKTSTSGGNYTAIYFNNDTTPGRYIIALSGIRNVSGGFGYNSTPCRASVDSNNMDANSWVSGTFDFSTVYGSSVTVQAFGFHAYTNGDAGSDGYYYGGGCRYNGSAVPSKISLTANTGTISGHWELWQGVTHSP